jgi:hypothetical protein
MLVSWQIKLRMEDGQAEEEDEWEEYEEDTEAEETEVST